ncbi:MAG: ABC transporter permease subunit [Oscillospiraceae bacterium]|nr:ABC transporter permease subunit [Oscillospiraceae bacterium]
MSDKNKKPSLFVRLFGNRNKQLSFMEEEQLQSPTRMIVRNFTSNKLGMTGLIVFLCIFLFVMIGPKFFVLDLSYNDNTQTNVPPTLSMLSVPEGLEGNVKDITPGTTFGVGVDNDGHIYTWGYTRITEVIDVGVIPDEVKEAHIEHIAAGYDHIAAIDDAGKVYVWGNDRLGQNNLPSEISTAMLMKKNLNFKQLEAGFQFTAALTEDGYLYMWGNQNMADIKVRKEYQGHIEKIALTTYNCVALLDDGTVAYVGLQKNSIQERLPEGLDNIVDIAATGATVAAVDTDGKITIWGNISDGLGEVPEMSAKPVELYGGNKHYTALLENGEVISWGSNVHKQSTVPESVVEHDIETVFAGFYQNYAITSEGETLTWGLKGYAFGTDDLGRDILTRLVNAGQVTMTVGAIAVVISLVIGIIAGGIAGYFGGWVDMIIMRIAEVIGGLPFIPFAMILSAIIGTRISVEQRMYLIMVVLGVLSWPGTCRLIRAQILSQREQEYVTAAQAMGVRERSIVFRHILPNVLSLILVSATLDFATCMLTESTLSYLGFGIAPPTPTWGNMLNGANNSVVIQQYWWRWVFTAAIFGVCTICINLVGDALRDAVDPKSNGR